MPRIATAATPAPGWVGISKEARRGSHRDRGPAAQTTASRSARRGGDRLNRKYDRVNKQTCNCTDGERRRGLAGGAPPEFLPQWGDVQVIVARNLAFVYLPRIGVGQRR